MCSQTVAQDYQNRGNHVIQNNSLTGQLSANSSTALIATNSPNNTMSGDHNLYMDPNLVNGHYQSPRVESRNDCLQGLQHHYQTMSTALHTSNSISAIANGSVPSSPLSTLSPPTSPSTNPPSLPPYLTDSLTSHRQLSGQPQQLYPYLGVNDIQIPQSPYFSQHLINSTQEFLPLCDLLFNIISLAAYFCDLVFDSVTAYTLYLQRDSLWLSITLGLILFSSLISQILSYRWYSRKIKAKESSVELKCQSYCVLTLHMVLCGVLWRYFKLFIPVDLSSVKYEVRDLCVLRMVHAFCEAAPMLIIQVYLLWFKSSLDQITDLNIISILLSLFNLCWALASFSKNVRSHNIHKLVLTWLGVIFQFFWRLGTISSRVVALTAYATIYSYWVFAVIVLHWFSMLLWLLSPKNLFYGEKMSSIKRFFYSCLIAWVYIFCYINMQEDNSKSRMIAFYSTMFLENTLLLSICLMLKTTPTSIQNVLLVLVLGGFAVGMFFMILYYKFFHIRLLKHSLMASNYDQMEYPSNHCPEHGHQYIGSSGHIDSRMSGLSNERILEVPLMNPTSSGVITGIPGVFNCRLNPALKRKKKKPSSFIPPPVPQISANPSNGVNGITSNMNSNNNLGNLQNNSVSKSSKAPPLPVPSPSAFWKKSEVNGFLHSKAMSGISTSSPLTLPAKHPFTASIASSPVANFTTDLHQQLMNANIAAPVVTKQPMLPNIPNNTPIPTQRQTIGPIGPKSIRRTPEPTSVSKVNIQQKLQEKKQQQFLQLKKIEEEIKQGIISKPQIMDRIESPPLIQKSAAPVAKKQPHLANGNNSKTTGPFVPLGNRGIHHYYYHPVYRRMKLRSQTPEVLLAPHYLDNSRVFYDYPSCVLPPIQSRILRTPIVNSVEEEEEEVDNNGINGETTKSKTNTKKKRNPKNSLNKGFKVCNNETNNKIINNNNNRFDIESQLSLPRSYTLPREFQYCRSGHTSALNGITDQNNYLKSCRIRKPLSSEQFLQNIDSNSSNDGDVDSDCFQTDMNPDDCDISAVPRIIRGPVNNMRSPVNGLRPLRDYNHRRYKRHETPL